jgi:hypothetical protein
VFFLLSDAASCIGGRGSLTEDTGVTPVSNVADPGTPLGSGDSPLVRGSTSFRSPFTWQTPLVLEAGSSKPDVTSPPLIYNCYYILSAIFICLISETE